MNGMCRSPARTLLCLAATAIPFFALAGTPELIADKTLVAWVRLDNLSQSGSGVISIQDGDEFDAIAFGEHVEGRWIAGSNTFQRTQSRSAQESLAPETARANQWLQLAIVYRANQIEIWRDGELYASYQARYQHAYFPRCDLYLGLRCIYGEDRFGNLRGAIDEARLYSLALDSSTIRQLKPGRIGDPKPKGCWTFDNGAAEDVMGNYPSTKLIGSATVKDGALALDGNGFALVSSRVMGEFLPPTVQAGFYTPPHRVGQMWDTWLYYLNGKYYMYYIAGPGGKWDAHEIAVSPDGVHWDFYGIALQPRAGTAWIGTGHVWKSPGFDRNGLWNLNYSEWFGDRQDIMFATSPDLLHWTRVDENFRFVQDTSWYKAKGRWDCIDVVHGEDGWLYGYFTADPDSDKVSYPHCGFGFARSRDGIRWEALPPVRGNMSGEFGGIQRFGNKYYITMSEGRIGVGDSPQGPFWGQKKNHNIFGGSIYFPRFFHTAPEGPLMNHFYTGGRVYAAPLKAVEIDSEGTLRLVWWRGNDKLKAARIPAAVPSGRGPVQWLDGILDVNQTLTIEGTIRLPAPGAAGMPMRGLLINQGNQWAECVSFEQTQTVFGSVLLDSEPMVLAVRRAANREMDFGREQRFRVLINRDMMEVYTNDYLTLQVRVNNTGRLGMLTGSDPGAINNLQIWRSANETERPPAAF